MMDRLKRSRRSFSLRIQTLSVEAGETVLFRGDIKQVRIARPPHLFAGYGNPGFSEAGAPACKVAMNHRGWSPRRVDTAKEIQSLLIYRLNIPQASRVQEFCACAWRRLRTLVTPHLPRDYSTILNCKYGLEILRMMSWLPSTRVTRPLSSRFGRPTAWNSTST